MALGRLTYTGPVQNFQRILYLECCIVFPKEGSPNRISFSSHRTWICLCSFLSPLSADFSVIPPEPIPSVSPSAGSQPFRCLYCVATFRFPGALQHHVSTEHFKQSENTFPCELCGELFTSQAQLDGHLESEHPKVTGTDAPAAASPMAQVILGPSDARALIRGS